MSNSDGNKVNETSSKDDKSADVIKSKASTSSASNSAVKPKRSMSPMLLTVLLALPIALVIAYIVSPDVFNRYLSMPFSDEEEVTTTTRSAADTGSVAYVPQEATQGALQNSPVTDWQAKRSADIEQRRAELAQRPAVNYPPSSYSPQWAQNSPAEPPQWVKDRQAEMEQQRQQYMKEMSEHQARWTNSQMPQYYPQNNSAPQNMPQQGSNQAYVNPYQQNTDVNRPQSQPMQPQGYYQQYNPYPYPAQQRYYAAPMQYYAPANRPYAYPGYR